MLELISEKSQNLKSFTENNYAQGAFFWTYLLKNKDIKVNGQRVSKDVLLHKGDIVCYYTTPKQEEKQAYQIVYQDENFLIADKESGVNSEAVYADIARKREAYFIHRLDRNTKGLLAFALNVKAETALLQAFKKQNVEKKYHALCLGVVSSREETLTAYLKKDEKKALVMIYDTPVKESVKIVTEYKVLDNRKDGTSLLEVTLHTGKTHQIRAHLAHVGYPILGDMKYGNFLENKKRNLSRQCLIAKSLRFCLQGEYEYLNDTTFISNFGV